MKVDNLVKREEEEEVSPAAGTEKMTEKRESFLQHDGQNEAS